MRGLALKRLTRSGKVVQVMNRLGHCINYHAIEEIETEATFESTNSNLFTPSGMTLDPKLAQAWHGTILIVLLKR